MIRFMDKIESMGLSYILEKPEYGDLCFENKDKLYEWLTDIIYNNRSVFVYGDYDVDGMTSIKNWGLFFDKLSHRKYAFYKYKTRTHKIDSQAIKEALKMKCNYMIINDAGSSDLLNINILVNNGIKVILLDHHISLSDYSEYPNNACVINTTIDNNLIGYDKYKCCTGALVYLTTKQFLEDRAIDTDDMACYALASLYADCMDMTNEINRAVYYTAIHCKRERIPWAMRIFMFKNSCLTRRFIEYSWSPKINAVFRSEQFKYLNDTFLYPNPMYSGEDIVSIFSSIQSDARNLVNKVSDVIYTEEMSNFVLGNLNSVDKYVSVEKNKLYNYTGLISNRVSSKFNKPCVILCYNGSSYKGSFRDRNSRDYLTLFKTFCNAEGHKPAFGIHLGKHEFTSFTENMEIIDSYVDLNKDGNEEILLDFTLKTKDTEVYSMARFNEFSGGTISKAYLSFNVNEDVEEQPNRYAGYKYKYGSYEITSPRRLRTGDKVIINPYLTTPSTFRLEVI